MSAKEIERAAYVAAHRILEANTTAAELACPGAQRSRAVDAIADIIREAFELQSIGPLEPASWQDQKVESGLRVVAHRRSAVLLELPVRASS